MDEKAITQFCQSPLTSPPPETRPTNRHAAYLIVIRGGMPGTMLRIGPDETTLGRSAENSFALDDMTVSRRHAKLQIDDDGLVTVTDEGSTNGTFINGCRIPAGSTSGVDEGDRLQLGSGVVLKLVRLDSSEEHFQQEMFERTVRDGLTGVYNRAYFLNQVGRLAARSAAQEIGMAILMIDVDHFKRVNDRYGHLVGDSVLREVSGVIRESTRSEDLVARYGGEEFIVALPSSSSDLAFERAEQIRLSVAGRRIRTAAGEVRVTVSVGLAYGSSQATGRPGTLIQSADEALYQAKGEGRNCVILAGDPHQLRARETQSVEILTIL